MGAILAESERKSREYFDSQFGKHETAVKAAFDAKLEATTTASQRPQFGGVSASENPAAAKAASVERESAAYRHWIRTNTVQPDWAAAKAAINEGTSSQGGYLVPTLYSNDLVTITYLNSVLRDAGARTIKVTGTNSFRVPTLTNSTAAVLTAEAAGFDEQEPTFAEIAFVPYKYTALAKASREAVDDSRIDVAGIVNDDANYRFVLAENIAFTTGTGSSQPQGIVIGATNGTTCASVSAITADEVIGHFHTVGYQYRNSPTFGWMMNDATVAYVRKMKDTANNYLWLNPSGAVGGGFTGPMQPTLLGKPVFTNNSMASALTTGQKLILAGDFRYFWIADFAQTEVQQLRELYAANGQIGYVFNKRIDAHVVLAAALQYLKLA